MSEFWKLTGWWLGELWNFLPSIFLRWLVGWLFCLLLLILVFDALKPRLRTRALQFDQDMNLWARGLRYKIREVVEPETTPHERNALTWFFRFWTNFASAPSLSFFAFALPIWFYRASFTGPLSHLDATGHFQVTLRWLLPGLCYFGSMGLSYVLKRVFKRLRPIREKGSFGHALKDGSFPSGHSLTAFCFWMALIACVFGATSSFLWTLGFAVLAIAIVLLTGLSRIYMAVHWPSDVAGGFVIGTVWTIVFLLLFASWI